MNVNTTYLTLALLTFSYTISAQTLAEARKAIDSEQYQKGKSLLRKLTVSEPANAEVYFVLGDLYLKTRVSNQRPDYIDSAKAAFLKGTEIKADYPLNFIGLGAVDLAQKKNPKLNFDKAIALTKKKDHATDLHIANAYINAIDPNLTEALVHLERAKMTNAKDPLVFLALGDAYRLQKKNSDAFSAYRSAYDMDKTLLRSKVELGKINKLSKAFPESIAEYNNVVALDPNYGPAYRELAEAHLGWSWTSQKEHETRIKQALQYYEKYMDLTDRSMDSRLRHADFLYLTKDFKALETEANAMAKIEKSDARVLRYLAYAAFENGNYPQTTSALKDFMAKVEPARIIGQDYLYLGRAQLKDSVQFNEGYVNLIKAIEKDSANIEFVSEAAQILYKGRKYDEAAKAYEVSIKNPKRNLQDYYFLGQTYYTQFANAKNAGQSPSIELLNKAEKAFAYLVEKAPTTQIAWIYRGRIHRLLDGEADTKGLGVPFFEKYVNIVTVEKPELKDKDSEKRTLIESYLYLGSVAARRDGNNAKALDLFKKALEIEPTNPTALQAIKALGG
ncbi:tetratricopeptide repeat protein [Daejeonella lutea]|uniref:Tetratricopeptide repeat-containing protein n=1 Tax=Daejeonella lutea TaxID=572036 RepID=A0A1T5A5F1_9SPHI|nr:hypothetical protein [Daejeonella lutea]SKB30242.1 hypothetical protein SAMN05661099_0350 [Daejeonella lutea]